MNSQIEYFIIGISIHKNWISNELLFLLIPSYKYSKVLNVLINGLVNEHTRVIRVIPVSFYSSHQNFKYS